MNYENYANSEHLAREDPSNYFNYPPHTYLPSQQMGKERNKEEGFELDIKEDKFDCRIARIHNIADLTGEIKDEEFDSRTAIEIDTAIGKQTTRNKETADNPAIAKDIARDTT